jgi:hypothetical protein
MTVKEMFESKYREYMKSIPERQWQHIKEIAEEKKMHPAQVIMMGFEITVNEANPRKNADVYWELIQMNKDKLIASNRHRQYSGKVDAFWLTKKGYKQLFAE